MSRAPDVRLPPGCDFAPDQWPSRSVLLGYAPQGIGTGMVVSLAGHLQDLAWAHGVPPIELLRWVAYAGSQPGVAGRSQADFVAMNRNLMRKPRATLVGPSKTSEVMVDAIGRLTLRDDIAATTVHGWEPVLPTKDSFRPELAYCPCCYEEWARPAHPGDAVDRPRRPYEPLIWQFTALEVCSRHEVRLRSECPNPACGARLGVVRAWARPGCCGRCGSILGAARDEVRAAEGELDADSLEWGRFVTEALCDLIANPPAADERISRRPTPEAVQIAVDRACQGSYTRFAEAIQMSLGSVSLWKDGHRRPTIKAALRICAVAGFRLPDFLAGRLDQLEAARPPDRAPYIPPSGETHHPHDPVAVKNHLERALRQNPAPSLASVQRGIHVHDRALARLYPEQHRRIKERREAWVAARMLASQEEQEGLVRAAIATLHADGRYPARRQVDDLLPSAVRLQRTSLEDVWKDEVVRLGYPRPDKPRRRTHQATMGVGVGKGRGGSAGVPSGF